MHLFAKMTEQPTKYGSGAVADQLERGILHSYIPRYRSFTHVPPLK